MTADEARVQAAHYRALTQRDIDPAIRECLLNLATIYEAYLSRLDKGAARPMSHHHPTAGSHQERRHTRP